MEERREQASEAAAWLERRRARPERGAAVARALARAIGVVYLPHRERQSHYFHAVLPDPFDAVLHCDETRAVEPLDRTAVWEKGEALETYPFGL